MCKAGITCILSALKARLFTRLDVRLKATPMLLPRFGQMRAKDSAQSSLQPRIVLLALILMLGEFDAQIAPATDSLEKSVSA